MTRARFLGLTLPWIGWTVWAFAVAYAGLPAYSPDTAMPFGLNQLAWWQPMIPLAIILASTVSVVAVTLHRADRWETLQ